MARPKKKEKTEQEMLEEQRTECIRQLTQPTVTEREFRLISEPTYKFNIGDEVRLGNLKECFVEEIFNNGKSYLIRCIATENNYGHPISHPAYRAVPWYRLRPIGQGNTEFRKNDDIRLYYNNSTIESLLHQYHNFGIDMEPEYQRGYVWTDADKEKLIDSIFENADIGKFVLIRLSNDEWASRDCGYEILDGKQRLRTLVDFYENRFAYHGKYYNDLSYLDRARFDEHNIAIANIDRISARDRLRLFLVLNRGGKIVDETVLNHVQDLYNNTPEYVYEVGREVVEALDSGTSCYDVMKTKDFEMALVAAKQNGRNYLKRHYKDPSGITVTERYDFREKGWF